MPLDRAPFGAIGLKTSFAVSHTALVATGRMTLERLLGLYVDGPAAITGIEAPSVALGKPVGAVSNDPIAAPPFSASSIQYQRNAADTRNTDDSLRFDATWEADAGFLKAIKAGVRWAERSFERASYQNPNQNAGVYTAWDGVRPPAQLVNIQRVPVNPTSTTDAGAAATRARSPRAADCRRARTQSAKR